MSKKKNRSRRIQPNAQPTDKSTVETEYVESFTETQTYSETDVDKSTDEVLDELAAMPAPNKRRVWEVDFLRGFLILFVVWDHFMWDVVYPYPGNYQTGLFQWLFKLGQSYYSGTLRATVHDTFVSLFVFLSGVSCSFSRNNFRRGVKMVVFAFALTAATYALSAISGSNLTIHFNVIHVIAFSVLIWSGIEWIWARCDKPWKKNIFGAVVTSVIVAVLVSGYVAKYAALIAEVSGNHSLAWTTEHEFWYFLFDFSGSSGYAHFCGGDVLAFFPDFAWFLVGGFLGHALYRNKESLFPSVNPKYLSPVTFCGRHSLWIYFGSQIVMYGLIYLLHGMFNVL